MFEPKRQKGFNFESAHVVKQGVAQLRSPAVKTSEKWLIAIGILYFLSPIDVLPDVLPPITYVDDFVVTGGTVSAALIGIIGRAIARKVQRTVQERQSRPPLQ